jgi:transcriptional regulator with XRE-family HTH domain
LAEPPTRDQIRRAFAQTVRSLRRKAGISQERLALNLGIDRANTAGLERGLHSPTLGTIFRLLPRLHVTLAEFAKEFERNLRAHGGAGEQATVPKHKGTR